MPNKTPVSLKDLQAIESLTRKHVEPDTPFSNDFTDVEATYQAFKTKLGKRIHELMEKNFEYLLNILYRIDVRESDLQVVLSNNQSSDLPGELADLVIQRQLEKVKWRQWMNNQ